MLVFGDRSHPPVPVAHPGSVVSGGVLMPELAGMVDPDQGTARRVMLRGIIL